MRQTNRCPEGAATDAHVQSDVDAMTAERGWEMVCMDQKVLKTIATGAPAQHTVTEDII